MAEGRRDRCAGADHGRAPCRASVADRRGIFGYLDIIGLTAFGVEMVCLERNNRLGRHVSNTAPDRNRACNRAERTKAY